MDNGFSVAIIPYTYENTNFKNIQVGDLVNIEFDMIGKYIQKIIKAQSDQYCKARFVHFLQLQLQRHFMA